MKEIIAIIRPNKVVETKKALADAGLPGFTGRTVRGRGKEPVDITLPNHIIMKTAMMQKRELIIEVEDEMASKVIDIIMEVNSTGNQGDGRIFVLPVNDSYTISVNN